MNNTIPTQVLDQPRVKLLGREQAILEFNRRVLAQAQREDVPLLERLRYICIVSSNLDEFFEVRYADVIEASRTPGTARIGSMEMNGLDGQITTASRSGAARAARNSGCGRACSTP